MEINKKKHKALVTGGSRGIGLAIAKRLVEDGLDVISTGTNFNGDHAQGSTYMQVDFLDSISVNEFLKLTETESIDVLVNNAGINKIDKFTEIAEEDFNNILEVNLKVPFLISQVAVKHMLSVNWGRIVNIGSIFSKVSKEYRGSYSASKFALDGLTAAMSAELSDSNILVNTVSPGFIDTELTKEILGKSGMDSIKQSIPAKRLGQVEEISSFVSWLVSEENTYISGQNLTIDGGFTRV